MEHALVPEYFGAYHFIRVHLTHNQKVVVSYKVTRSSLRGNTVHNGKVNRNGDHTNNLNFCCADTFANFFLKKLHASTSGEIFS